MKLAGSDGGEKCVAPVEPSVDDAPLMDNTAPEPLLSPASRSGLPEAEVVAAVLLPQAVQVPVV